MKATAENEIGHGRSVTVFAMPEPAIAPSRDIVSDHRAANSDDYRPKSRQAVEAAAARIGRAIVGVVRGLRDGAERRRTLRELRLMSRSRLADIGIEAHNIERVVDDMIVAHRLRTAAAGRRSHPRCE